MSTTPLTHHEHFVFKIDKESWPELSETYARQLERWDAVGVENLYGRYLKVVYDHYQDGVTDEWVKADPVVTLCHSYIAALGTD